MSSGCSVRLVSNWILTSFQVHASTPGLSASFIHKMYIIIKNILMYTASYKIIRNNKKKYIKGGKGGG